MPLFSVDTHRAAGEFDVIAFNLSAELVYTNVLECLDLAGIPVRAIAGRPEHPRRSTSASFAAKVFMFARMCMTLARSSVAART